MILSTITLSVTVITGIASVCLTAIGMLSAFMYKQGFVNNELKNLRDQQTMIKTDLKADIDNMEEKKVDKDVFLMVLSEIKEMKTDLKADIKNILKQITNKDK